MTLPKMIIFDYGHTLVYESGFDSMRAQKEIMKYAVKNENNLTAEDVNSFSETLYQKIMKKAKSAELEVHNHMFQRLKYEYLGIALSLSPLEEELLYWDTAAPGEPMPNICEVIDYINNKGIRSAVISNISFSGEALKARINHLIPNHKFEFIIASSEYAIKKPDTMLFELALKKAHLLSDDVWFCGDNAKADIEGAASVGITPVWFQSGLECFYADKECAPPSCKHIHITDWLELIDILEKAEDSE